MAPAEGLAKLKTVFDAKGSVIPLPKEIEAGVKDVAKRDGWNKPAPDPYGQKDKFYGIYPNLKGKTTDVTQGSTFYPETIENIRSIRKKRQSGEIPTLDRWVVLGSNSWIKGTEDAIKYCKDNNMNHVVLSNLPNEQFLMEIAKSKGLVFFPRDIDVGSRITTETKLLGGETIVNDNVLHVKEAWFNKPTEEIERYLLDGPTRFWKEVNS
jgi:hypothetical protein